LFKGHKIRQPTKPVVCSLCRIGVGLRTEVRGSVFLPSAQVLDGAA